MGCWLLKESSILRNLSPIFVLIWFKHEDEIAKLTGKTRKQVCVWCAHRREKIKKEKQKTTKKRKAETTSNAYYQSKRRKTEHYQGIDPDAISILRTALIGRVLDSQENVALVSCLINTDIDIVNRWVNDHIHASAALVRGWHTSIFFAFHSYSKNMVQHFLIVFFRL